MEKIDFTPEEVERSGMVKRPLASGVIQFNWSEEKMFDADISFTSEEWARIKFLAENWTGFTPADRVWWEPILEQLGV